MTYLRSSARAAAKVFLDIAIIRFCEIVFTFRLRLASSITMCGRRHIRF